MFFLAYLSYGASIFHDFNFSQDDENLLTNNALSFPAEHPFLQLALEKMVKSYNKNCWTCIGPSLMTKTLFEFAGIDDVNNVDDSVDLKIVQTYRYSYQLTL